MTEKEETAQNRIKEIEVAMASPDFWQNKDLAQKMIQELQDLRDEAAGVDKNDKLSAIVTVFAGAGGDDAEDWARMLLAMYQKFSEGRGWRTGTLDQNQNDNGGYRSVTFEVEGKNAYGILKSESGVHRLVRKSPFNSAGKRQTSFAMVEVIPKFDLSSQKNAVELQPDELQIDFTKSSGPGGQNVNKRETAVRITHLPTGATAFVSTERSQAQNKEKAMEIIRGKIFTLKEKQRLGEISELKVSKTTAAEWGSQIRSYVLHPYKLVKDHRNGIETSNVAAVLEGDIDLFINPAKTPSENVV